MLKVDAENGIDGVRSQEFWGECNNMFCDVVQELKMTLLKSFCHSNPKNIDW
jgi:hypothetical protein